jgi:hypothetical protein
MHLHPRRRATSTALIVPGRVVHPSSIVVKEAATVGPIPIELSLRNHHGVETAAPSALVRETAGTVTIREGIAFR